MAVTVTVALLAAVSLTVLAQAQSPLDEDLLNMAEKGQTALVETLLSVGADVDSRDAAGRTALMMAAAHGYATTVAALLDAGADVKSEAKDGDTALTLATRNGHLEIAQLLRIDPQARQRWEQHYGAGAQAYQQGRYSDAETSWLAALEQAEGFGDDSIPLATSLNNLGDLYRAQGRYGEVEPLLRRALAIYQEVLGPEHFYVATSLDNLALLYRTQGKYSEAGPLYLRALAIKEKALGREHPNLADSLEDYATLLSEMDREAEALELEERARRIRGR